MIFFDHNATTKISAAVLEKMLEAQALPLNSSSNHAFGRISNQFADAAREKIKKLLNADNYEVIFTSGATESNNTIIRGCAAQRIISSDLNHPSISNFRPINKIFTEVEILKNGLIDLDNFSQKLPKSGDFLTSLTLANNETGAIQPVIEASKLTHQKSGLIHCDISQAVGKIKVDLEKINADFASISAHKFDGPQGIGAILIRRGLEFKPLLFGGGQEKSKRGGTLNIAGIVGFGAACDLAEKRILEFTKVKKLRDLLEEKMQKIAGENIKIFAQTVNRLPNTSYFSLKNRDSQTQLINFDLNQICVSSGSACSSGSVNKSQLLKAMNVKKEFLDGAIRVSLGVENTTAEIEKFISVFEKFYLRTNQ